MGVRHPPKGLYALIILAVPVWYYYFFRIFFRHLIVIPTLEVRRASGAIPRPRYQIVTLRHDRRVFFRSIDLSTCFFYHLTGGMALHKTQYHLTTLRHVGSTITATAPGSTE